MNTLPDKLAIHHQRAAALASALLMLRMGVPLLGRGGSIPKQINEKTTK